MNKLKHQPGGIFTNERLRNPYIEEEDRKFEKDLKKVEESYSLLTNIESKLKSYLSGGEIPKKSIFE